MPESREDSVYLAKLAEQAERYEGQSSYRAARPTAPTAADVPFLCVLILFQQRWSRT